MVNNYFLTFINIKNEKKIWAAGDKTNLEIFMTYTYCKAKKSDFFLQGKREKKNQNQKLRIFTF